MPVGSLKTMLREAIPPGRQVPVKYLFDRLRGTLESELALLPAPVGRGQRAIDTGGNRGTYAYRLARLGARVEMFEPNPVYLQLLQQWAQGRANNHFSAVALSSHAGEETLLIPVDAVGFVHDALASIEHSPPGVVRDPVVALAMHDSFAFADVELIKIEVEGQEVAMIGTAAATIAKHRLALLVEIERRPLQRSIDEFFARNFAIGYESYFLRVKKFFWWLSSMAPKKSP